MNQSLLAIEQVLQALPADGEERRIRLARARAYAAECGCSLAGVFLLLSAALVALYGIISGSLSRADALVGTLVVFGASIVGKLLGIGVARLRLALLARYIIARYRSEGA